MEYSNQTNSVGNDVQNQASMPVEPVERTAHSQPRRENTLSACVIIAALIIAGTVLYAAGQRGGDARQRASVVASDADGVSALENQVVPPEGITLPARWGDLGAKLVSIGVIDADQLVALYNQRGEFSDEYREILLGNSTGEIRITRENAGYWLNLLWALGLANKNSILETGEMADQRYGGAQNFASTGGWTLAKGGPESAMEHYSRHKLFELTDTEQALVDEVSRGIYRPCCGNSTHFPDCNHGMAMLGLLELMASQGATKEEMYQAALAVNSYWFPDTYLAIAKYFENRGVSWDKVDAKEVLGAAYSSASGYQNIRSKIEPIREQSGGGGCGV